MMLLTLVENAVKHGLAPPREGGRIRSARTLEGARCSLEVADTGRGFGEGTSGGGTGLANIRARLSAMFGSGGQPELAATRRAASPRPWPARQPCVAGRSARERAPSPAVVLAVLARRRARWFCAVVRGLTWRSLLVVAAASRPGSVREIGRSLSAR